MGRPEDALKVDALKRLDGLTQEARMAAAQLMNAIDCEVGQVADGVDQIEGL